MPEPSTIIMAALAGLALLAVPTATLITPAPSPPPLRRFGWDAVHGDAPPDIPSGRQASRPRQEFSSVPKTVPLLRLAASQNAHNWQPSVIPRKGLPLRDSKTVPSKGSR